MEDMVIKTGEVKGKLQGTRMFSGHIEEFCRLLADRLNEECTPLGFLMAYNILATDLEKGDGLCITTRGQKVRTHLSGIPLGAIYQMCLPQVAEAVLPAAFAEQVKSEWNEVLKAAEAGR